MLGSHGDKNRSLPSLLAFCIENCGIGRNPAPEESYLYAIKALNNPFHQMTFWHLTAHSQRFAAHHSRLTLPESSLPLVDASRLARGRAFELESPIAIRARRAVRPFVLVPRILAACAIVAYVVFGRVVAGGPTWLVTWS